MKNNETFNSRSGLKKRLFRCASGPLSIMMAACLIATVWGGPVAAAQELDGSRPSVMKNVIKAPSEEFEKPRVDDVSETDYGPWNGPGSDNTDDSSDPGYGPWNDPDLDRPDNDSSDPGYGPWNGPGSDTAEDEDDVPDLGNGSGYGNNDTQENNEPLIYIIEEENDDVLVREDEGLSVISPAPNDTVEKGENKLPEIREIEKSVSGHSAIAVLEGNGGIISAGEALTVRLDAKMKDLLEVRLDGVTLEAAAYTVSEGSTIITLKDTTGLEKGAHRLTAVFATGEASVDFKVVDVRHEAELQIGSEVRPQAVTQSRSPQTGDWQNVSGSLAGMMTGLISAVAATISLMKTKRKK
ncbi:MAG: hypothetical protein Q4D52_01285 [Eubacteriales bacterium]|nr:hypothetical protein [Eubacteriales bacterium]